MLGAGLLGSGQTSGTRAGSILVITVYDLTGKPLAAHRRRRKKKVQ